MGAIMVQSVSSWAGKSLLTTALARLFARRGIRVAPFKAQNMSNNARVVEGGEIGTAQYLQALAAGAEPDVRMNPVLVKPEGDCRSQVVVAGKVDRELSGRAWRDRGPALWPPIETALRSLIEDYELVVIEGAGSPAEINLRSTDLANMRVAHAASAPVLLVADINRGGAFAHLYGTWSLLDEPDRRTIRAFVLNKFRGDRSLLPPAPEELERRTGVPVAGTIPWLEHGLPDEDGAAQRPGQGTIVAVVRYPTASNLDELRAADQVAEIRFATTPAGIAGAELVVLPGSKHVAADLDWLRRTGLAAEIERRAADGTRVLGICGGMQMLGRRLSDTGGVDGAAEGLGLLDLDTDFEREKLTRRVVARFAELQEPWAALSGIELEGYEIRHGRSSARRATRALGDELGFVQGSVLGISVHGLLENAAACDALLGAAPQEPLDSVFDRLADAVEAHLDVNLVFELAGVR
jgi:adenosylcobyric acid synthase